MKASDCTSYGKDTKYSENGNNGLNIEYTNGDICDQANNIKWQTMIELHCDDSVDNPDNINWSVTTDQPNCVVTISGDTSAACSVANLSVLIEFVNEYQVYFAIGGVIIGLLLMFVGFWLFKVTIFIIAVLAVSVILLAIIYGAIGAQPTAEWVTWLVLGICLVAGILAGVLLIKFQKVAVFILGAIGGWVLAFTLYDLFLYKISSS